MSPLDFKVEPDSMKIHAWDCLILLSNWVSVSFWEIYFMPYVQFVCECALLSTYLFFPAD